MEVAAGYVDQILIFSIFALSLNLLLGYAGQVSVAHAAFGAVGGYALGYVALNRGWGTLEGLLLGLVVAGLFGAIVALPALRLSVEFLILLTLAVSFVVLSVVTTFSQLGGTYGLIGIPRASVFGVTLDRPSKWVIPLGVFVVLTYALCHRLGESPFGRVLKGIRDDDRVTTSLGKNVVFAKVVVFGVTSALAGLAGGLLASFNELATPGQFSLDISLSIFAMVIFGGMGNLTGSLIGATAVVLTRPFLEWAVDLSPETATLWRLAVYGVLLVVLMRLRPQGLLPEGVSPLRWLRRSRSAPAATAPVEVGGAALLDPNLAFSGAANGIGGNGNGNGLGHAPPLAPMSLSGSIPSTESGREQRWQSADAVLEVRGLTKHFGGIVAAQDLDMTLHRGTITALVGPNGAGKTTVFNLLTGFIPPDAGSVKLHGRELVGLKPNVVARHGLVRSFQDVRVIPRLTALQNVMLAVQGQPAEELRSLFLQRGRSAAGERETKRKALDSLAFVGMTSEANTPAGALSFGQSKLVALARVLATDAEVLLLDEPASGIDTQWVDTMLELIERLRSADKTVCIVEHNLQVVSRLADHTYFMELGRITDQGTISELVQSPRLTEAYFGTA